MTAPKRRGSNSASQERVALVTGASKGIGRATALRLAQDGAAVAVNYFSDSEGARSVVDAIAAVGGRAGAFQADVGDAAAAENLVADVVDHFGQIDILVNNAAIFPWQDWDGITIDDWDRVFDVNVRGSYFAAKAACRDMRSRGWGRLIFMSSGTFLTGNANLIHYAATKGALVGLTRSLALAVGDFGITANAVTTGRTLTEGLEQLIAQGVTTMEESRSRTSQPIKRLATPDDIVGTISFLASDDASYMTGQLLNVDGGRTMH